MLEQSELDRGELILSHVETKRARPKRADPKSVRPNNSMRNRPDTQERFSQLIAARGRFFLRLIAQKISDIVVWPFSANIFMTYLQM